MKIKYYALLIIVMALSFTIVPKSKATETSTQLLFVNCDCNLMDSPSDDANAIQGLTMNDIVVIIGSIDNGWIQIKTDNNEGFIKTEYLSGVGNEVIQDVQNAAIDDEIFIREAERTIKQKKEMIMWGCIIGILLLAFIAVTVLNALKKMDKRIDKIGKE